MNFWNSFQKVATWSAASYLYVRRYLKIVSVLIQDNKHVIFNFASSLLAQRAGRRERYQILLEASKGYELAKIEALKRRFDAIFPPLGVLDSPKSMEVAVADAPRTIEERLDALEDAVRSLSAEFATFTFNHVLTKQAPTVQVSTNRAPTVQTPTNRGPTIQAPINRAPTIHTSAQTRTVTKSWCYYHIRFGKDSRKCSSDLCTFSPKISTKNITSKNVIFIFASSRLVERASRREHLSTSREVDVADAARTIDERLGMLEDAVRSLSAEFALFTLNNVLKNQAPTGQAQTNRAPPIQAPKVQAPTIRAPLIHTSAQTRTIPKSWCYYHVRFGKDARKCSSDLCTFSRKISTEKKTFKKLYTSDKPEQRTYRYNTWTDF
ncbi:hypothetical protein AGLY_017872 [Aphis glycines]|uniref:Uncharacterized protein n=1 Tax=Aphis glycines TaxID=307491 RepID=A0A6G0SUU3_APHGL|nr:hypothetical protein AGLY_017872 [Aphis glycines]